MIIFAPTANYKEQLLSPAGNRGKVGNKSEKCTDPNLWEADKLGDDDPRCPNTASQNIVLILGKIGKFNFNGLTQTMGGVGGHALSPAPHIVSHFKIKIKYFVNN